MICCLIVRLIIIIHWWEKTVGPIFLYPLITRLKAYLNYLPFFLCLCSSDSWKHWYWKKMNSLYSHFFTMPLPQAVAKESLQMCTQFLPPQLWAACSARAPAVPGHNENDRESRKLHQKGLCLCRRWSSYSSWTGECRTNSYSPPL